VASVAVGGALAAAALGAPAAHADNSQDLAFVALTAADNIHAAPGVDALANFISWGKAVCVDIRQGTLADDEAWRVYVLSSLTTIGQARTFVVDAATAYCPEQGVRYGNQAPPVQPQAPASTPWLT
jgi:hypothetical protein